MSGKIIGIDLGTTNSVVSVIENGKPVVIANQEGARTMPSIVAFTEKGDILVGAPAKNQMVTNPENTIYSAKRFIGHRFEEVSNEHMPYVIKKGPHDNVVFQTRIGDQTPEQISAFILTKLKEAAESYLGGKIHKAVITVPAYFNDSQRQSTKDAGTIAGLEVERIINEPTAAALAYGLDKNKEGIVAVYDFGGGTFDISILEIGDGVFEVKATNGDTHLGGDDLDNAIIKHIITTYQKESGIDLSKDPMAMQRLKEAAEKAKIELSSKADTQINLPFITADASGPKHLQMNMTRGELENIVRPIVERSISPCEQVLKDAGISKSDINEIILVGGQTRMPLIVDLVKNFFGKEPSKGVNPDEVVSLGAAIQAGVLNKEVNDILLLDVTPLSLGIVTLGDVNTVLIPRNTTIPASKSQIFSTAADNQTAVTIQVLQGERPMAKDNRTLGNFNLEGIQPAPRGIPQIEVTFDIDANGILHVSAKDSGSGKEQKIRIESTGTLSADEIERMQKEAEVNAEDDKKVRENIELKNQANSVSYGIEKLLREEGDKISDTDKKELEEKNADLKKAIEGDDMNTIEAAMKALEPVSARVYQQMAAAAQQNSSHKSDEREDDVIDAEVIDKDKE
ncbi:molecular chaperone DnaK [Brevinema andersonii]|uniref:Chaperone protein DnaK n=1 Tax=Brevinema andersonii TaxID=34097 RepID=A0A1I1DPT7_BREAD|nr:molecular chaperone DnaK [Brevinema andersonii]SFB76854.1 molecular chaperone DnaK [Brevinema andersonii]